MDQLNLFDYFSLIYNNKKTFVFNFIIASVVFIIISITLPKKYTATTVIMPPASDNVGLDAGSMLQNMGVPSFLMNGGSDQTSKLIAILKSDALARSIIQQFNLLEAYEIEKYADAIMAFRGNLIYLIGDEGQIYISYTDRDQDLVADITNAIVTALDSINIQLSIQKAKEARSFIENRFNLILDSLTILENDLRQYREQNKLYGLESQVAVEVQNAAELESELMLKRVQLEILKQTQNLDNPQIQQLGVEIATSEKLFKEFFFQKDTNNIIINIADIPKFQQQSLLFQRKMDYYVKLAEYLGPQYEQAKINEAKKISTVQVLDAAVRPAYKSRPRRSLVVIGGVLFVMIATWVWVIATHSLKRYHLKDENN